MFGWGTNSRFLFENINLSEGALEEGLCGWVKLDFAVRNLSEKAVIDKNDCYPKKIKSTQTLVLLNLIKTIDRVSRFLLD